MSHRATLPPLSLRPKGQGFTGMRLGEESP